MNALPKLAEWSKELPDWLSDMARRAILKGTLDSSDFDDAEALLLTSIGIPDSQERSATRLEAGMIPVPIDSGDAISLTAIREPLHVNALDGKTSLTFGAEGLTVIWGPNGAGKSGFIRILKRACRSRDQESILPNVFATGPTGTAQAQLEWKSSAGPNSQLWIDGQSKYDDLSKVVIFDGRCARLFIDDEQEVNIVLYGVDALREMARGCQEVKRRLETKQSANRVDTSTLDSLRGDTTTGRYIQALSGNSNKQTASDLANLSEAEEAELKTLGEQLSDDPVKKANTTRRLVQRYKLLGEELHAYRNKLSDPKIEAFRDAMAAYKRADEASRLASNELHEDGRVLPGTGDDPWRDLMTSALAYAQHAYPGEDFPANRSDVRCVLCQQSLGDDARERLKGFVNFLRADSQKKRDTSRSATGALYKAFEEIDLSRLPSDKTILDELGEHNSETKEQYVHSVAALNSRRTALIEQAKTREIGTFEQLPEGPDEAIEQIWHALETQAVNLEKAGQAESRKQMVARHIELAARSKLKELLPLVTKTIDAFALQAKLENALKQTNTNGITRKSMELTEAAIASGLNAALNQEFEGLKLANLKLEIGLRGQRGQGMQQLRLIMSKPTAKAKVSDILSEGEQRAIAIACFLAETNLVSQSTSMVFDDPVSSVDHYRRELIANRLAAEACKRQVIVFTHDLSFAWDLTEAAKKSCAKYHACRIYPAGPNKGIVAEGLPHEGGKIAARINALDQLATRAKKTLEEDKDPERYEVLVRDGYRKLRDAWERLIEECLFGDTVRRFRNSVQTRQLRLAEIEDQDVVAVDDGMTKCSMYTHDAPTESPPSLPHPDDFAADIVHLRTTHARIEARMKVTEKRRETN